MSIEDLTQLLRQMLNGKHRDYPALDRLVRKQAAAELGEYLNRARGSCDPLPKVSDLSGSELNELLFRAARQIYLEN